MAMAEAAKRVGVGEATVKRARFVLEHGTSEQVVAVAGVALPALGSSIDASRCRHRSRIWQAAVATVSCPASGDRGNQYTGGKGSRDPLPNGSDAAEFIS